MSIEYYKLEPEQIFQDITRLEEHRKIRIKGIDFLVYPHVYPSEKFRTTSFLLDNIHPLINDAHICDMGCGFGIVGLFALRYGAKSVVQADINPIAVENAKKNKTLNGYSQQVKIYTSDCFDRVPRQTFDLVVFNIPFHTEAYEIQNPLQYAFHDPLFCTTRKFLTQATNHCHSNTKIIIAFSNKGDTQELEKIFDHSGFKWKLWRIANSHQKFDNRLYLLKT